MPPLPARTPTPHPTAHPHTHTSLPRPLRSVRADRIQELRWTAEGGSVLPGGVRDQLSTTERDLFRDYAGLVTDTLMDIGLDLTKVGGWVGGW